MMSPAALDTLEEMEAKPNVLPKVLIVDDDLLNTKLLAAKIDSESYNVAIAHDGYQCLDMVAQEAPDLILLDIMMPEMDGFEVCEKIKADAQTAEIPILFITSLVDDAHKRRGFEIGAVDYITKPFDEAEVKARVQTHLALKNNRDALQRQNALLDEQVQARTADLSAANAQLKAEIAAKIKINDQLLASEAKSKAIVDALPDEVLHINGGRKIVERKGAGRIFPQDQQEIIGLPLAQVLPAGIVDEAENHLVRVLNDEGIAVFDFPLAMAGKPRHCEARLVKIAAHEALMITRDITDRKQAEDALRERELLLAKENRRLKASMKERYRLGDIIGKSAPMQQVYDLILKAAEHDISVMIYGESGTGKELVARAVHRTSPRRQNTFIPVNCGAIPENLIESEFFGYHKGAFTGADENKAGFLKQAHGGTLFLDEIGDISLNMQVKLLRVIDGAGYIPIGSRRTETSDVRFIGATNKDLTALVKEGKMREDFFYRVHIVAIELPPLRDRKEDLPLLVEHFYHEFARHHEKPPPLTGKLQDHLAEYHWPGNVRELQNTLHRYITSGNIDFMGTSLEKPAPASLSYETELDAAPEDYKSAMEGFEKQLILRSLKAHRWHREKAAESLGVSRRTFFRKLKNLGIVTQ